MTDLRSDPYVDRSTQGAGTLPPAWWLLLRQAGYELRLHGRIRALLGLELALPLALLGILGTLLHDMDEVPEAGAFVEIFVPNMVAVGLATTCFAGLGIAAAYLRITGVVKRLRGTPVPGWVPITALGLQSVAVGFAVATALALGGWWWLDVTPPAAAPFLLAVLVGAAAFVALGVAASTFVTRVEAAPAVTNLVLWPMAFVSGTFAYVEQGTVLHRIGTFLPLRHLQDATVAAFHGRGVEWGGLVVVAVWGLVGVVVAGLRWPRRA